MKVIDTKKHTGQYHWSVVVDEKLDTKVDMLLYHDVYIITSNEIRYKVRDCIREDLRRL